MLKGRVPLPQIGFGFTSVIQIMCHGVQPRLKTFLFEIDLMIGLDTERKRDKKKLSLAKNRLTLSMSVICEKGGWVG